MARPALPEIASLRTLNITSWEELSRTRSTLLLKHRGIGWKLLRVLGKELQARGLNVPWADHRPVECCGVYFIGCGNYVKIGQAYDVDRRYNALQASLPFDLVLLGVLPCDVRSLSVCEGELHQRFAALRHRGEWFRLETPILLYIDALQRGVLA